MKFKYFTESSLSASSTLPHNYKTTSSLQDAPTSLASTFSLCEWSPPPEAPVEEPKTLNVTPHHKRHPLGSVKWTQSIRRARLRASAYLPPLSQSAPIFPSTSHLPPPEDSIEDQLSMLIEEGKKALGKEVVVMSEDPADEVDDGNNDWEEDDAPCTS
ncbi:hypothetical protein ARMGADRAFT_1083169 [Armillaria gallica]|uniref:Uncharacterized protein n=1 Tax=Armillaria gallica TaxID=47427 RepID=A0A2H3CSS5_ARMGA|nr:hypothetical protein ARMGADRAFT_1093393 [Armillaria gallica]PBK90314.1 hypothetical protein ARMGADRAFT_1083169 [Armillaria gallica]